MNSIRVWLYLCIVTVNFIVHSTEAADCEGLPSLNIVTLHVKQPLINQAGEGYIASSTTDHRPHVHMQGPRD